MQTKRRAKEVKGEKPFKNKRVFNISKLLERASNKTKK